PEQRERLAAATQRGSAQAAGGTAPAVAEQQQRLVYVWPHLVTIELLSAMLMMLSMFVIGYILQAPLEAHANADRTPNPSKAPWYFLNLQELLLHMHPALAGVLVPSGALALIAIIPYIDRNTRDVGKWFGTPKAVPIFWFTTWYTTIVLILEIMFDEYVGVKPMMARIAELTRIDFFRSGLIVDIVVPLFLMTLPIVILVGLLQRIYKPDGARDWMIAFFTGFLVVYVVLTIFGTFFRGQGMHLYWPWDQSMIRIE
ncbi:MAG: menaquinol-cytochrome C reductase, partial [Chloroflexi bacterium]|nr:menaquinol-cytochrome C reductase [Chloroflexota bacterium]